jgi:photosystem II stability/assembly factor-like uncharacterized protein
MLDSTHGWIVGKSGTVLHYDGTVWIMVAALTSVDLHSVIQVGAQEAWAVGDSGTIIHWNGFAWYPYIPSPPLIGTPSLNSVFILANGYGLIVGDRPSAGSSATVLLVNQQITPIPEMKDGPVALMLTLLALLVFTKRRRCDIVRNH